MNNMSTSGGSDEIVLARFRRKYHNAQGPHGSRVGDPSWQSPRWNEPNNANNSNVRDDQVPTPEPHTKYASNAGPSQPRTPAKGPNDKFKVAPPETLAELKKYQQQVVKEAHLNRFNDDSGPDISPKFLARVREGPGTDPTSEIYQKIENRRQTPGYLPTIEVTADNRNASPNIESCNEDSESEYSKFTFEDAAGTLASERYKAQWILYADSPRAYPKVENGMIVLSSEPTPGHEYVPVAPEEDGLKTHHPRANKLQVGPETHSWTDVFFADWEYRPRSCSSYEAFRDTFRRWLDATIGVCHKVDIYHQAYFDGTAHSDGMRSLYLPDIETSLVLLDMENAETRLHAHETSEGYCHNLDLYIKKEKEAEVTKKKAQRQAYLNASQYVPVPSPKSPSANIYLRPVETGDIPGLLEIFNWYINNTTLPTNVTLMSSADARQLIENCKQERLPFLVAAERRTGLAARNIEHNERIFGYALAKDFIDQRSTGRFTVELQLFVREDKKYRGIGRSLMDKLLEVCDATYNPQKGYFFDSNFEDRPGYFPGGHRKLARLIIAYTYPNEDEFEYEQIKAWLGKYRFKEQGLLKGVRVKFEKL